MTTRKIVVVSAGLGAPSSTRLLADRLATATVEALAERDVTVEVHVVELRNHARAIADNFVTGFANEELQAEIDAVVNADGLIVASPVFTASYSGLFKSFFDVIDKDALVTKPLLMAATAGTERHSLVLEHAMRPLFAYLRALVVPTGVFAASEDWAGGGVSDALATRVVRAAGELADLVAGRPAAAPADELGGFTPFEQLLNR